MLFYGVSFVSTRIALGALGPITVLAVRLLLSALFLVVLDAVLPGAGRRSGRAASSQTPREPPRGGDPEPEPERRPGSGQPEPERRPRRWPLAGDMPAILLVTLFQPILYFLAENFGLRQVSASIAAIIIATIPVFTPLVAGPFLGERMGLRGVIGLLLSLGGVVIIVLERQLEAQFTPVGLLLVFLAVLAAVGYSVAIKKAPSRYRPLTIVKLQSLLGLPMILVLGLIFEGVPRQMPEPQVIGHLLYLGLFPSSLAFVFLSTGIRALGPSRANVFTNLVPGFTAVFSWLLIGEAFTLQKVVGMLVVIAGVLTTQVGRRRPGARAGSEEG
jgi:drug/metabolite transporter (DMT)-like permease